MQFYLGGQSQFLNSAFAQPETLSKIELIYTRAYNDLKGVTDAMDQNMSRVLANGLAAGQNPTQIASEMTKQVKKIGIVRARAIARTEIISAHAEGQLDAFEKLGVAEVGVMAEWVTGGDPCELCAELEGVVMTVVEARGLIPRHPNCKCSWIPANVGESKKGQLWDKKKTSAIKRSLAKEGGAKKSSWLGKSI